MGLATREHASRFRPDIEGLRAVAVGLVIASHLSLGLPAGFIGVDVFFVISGYLITGLMLKEYGGTPGRPGTGTVSICGFYLRRARRILPAAVLCLGVTVLLSRVLLNPGAAESARADGVWALVFLENRHLIDMATDYFQQGFAPSPVQHYWSLSVEEQFYLLWPALLLLVVRLAGQVAPSRWLRRVAVTAAVLSVGSLLWSVHLSRVSPTAGYFSAPGRAFELGTGALAACWAYRHPAGPGQRGARVLGPAGLALLLLALVVVDPGSSYPGWRGLLPTAGTGLLLVAGLSGGPVATGLSLPPVRFLGRISYSLYLWHWPAVVLVQERLPHEWARPVRVAVLLLGTVAVSAASFAFVERPFLRHGAPRHRPAHLRPATGLLVPRVAWTLVLALALAAGTTISLLPTSRTPGSAAAALHDVAVPTPMAGRTELLAYQQRFVAGVAKDIARRKVPADLTPSLTTLAERHAGQPTLCHVSPCSKGTGPRHALILGDSFAQVSSPLLVGALDLTQWTVTLRWKSHCHIAFPDECPALFDLGSGHLDLLVLSDYVRAEPGRTMAQSGAGLRRSLARLARRADHVVYLGQLPGMHTALIDCVSGAQRLRDSCYWSPAHAAEANRLKREAVTRVGGTFVDPTPWLCRPARCAVVVGSRPVFVDMTHLEAGFASLLAPLLRLALLDAHVV